MPKETDSNKPQGKRDWRYYLGLLLFIIGLILPLLALVLVPLLGLSASFSTVLYGLSVAGGPDVLLIGAAALMGKENMGFLFSKLGSRFKNLVKWDQVSHKRYVTGLWLMGLSIIVTLILFYFLPDSFRDGNQLGWGYYVTVGADILFIIAFFVLGAEFWAKIQALFQYDARVIAKE